MTQSCGQYYGHIPFVDEAGEIHAPLHFSARHFLLRYYDAEEVEALGYLHDLAFVNNSHLLKWQLDQLVRHISRHLPGLTSAVVLDEIISYVRQ